MSPHSLDQAENRTEKCPHYQRCSACSLWEIPSDQQLALKRRKFFDLWNRHEEMGSFQTPSWNSIFEHQGTEGQWLRQRAELQIRNSKVGFHIKEGPALVYPAQCKVLEPSLKEWVDEISRSLPSIAKGSLRARVSPQGLRGLWLDLPNLTVKELLSAPQSLEKLMSLADVIEIGQRRKVLIKTDSESLKLTGQPEYYPWTRTWCYKTPIDLYSCVGDFSQPSDGANRVIANLIISLTAGSQKIFEFGAGFGNLSLPALASGGRVVAIERNPRGEAAVRKTLAALPTEISERLTWLSAWAREDSQINDCDTLLLNPSREGASQFLSQNFPKKVKKIVMMSCYPESFIHDVGLLRLQGFMLGDLHLIDQFPYTDHLEVIGVLHR